MVYKKKQGLVINNSTLLFFIAFVALLYFIYFIYFTYFKFNQNMPRHINNSTQDTLSLLPLNNSCKRETDVLLNPYDAPLRDERLFNNSHYNNNNIKIPINIPTQSYNTNYRQLGILTRVNRDDTILPLMGRPLIVNRDKWNYYTMNDKNNMIKLPISFKNRSCTSNTGCDSVYNGDTVYVEGYSDLFRVTLYDNATMEYIPHL
jgi:hypothetical protein